MTNSHPILDIQHATVYRGDTCVFTDFSLSLQEGEHVAILGPNGAGKSTFLRLLAGEIHFVPNDEMHIRLFGEEGWNVWDVRKRLCMVAHDLQHYYMENVTGLKVVLSGHYASIGIYGAPRLYLCQIVRAHVVMEELGIGFLTTGGFSRCRPANSSRINLRHSIYHRDSGVHWRYLAI